MSDQALREVVGRVPQLQDKLSGLRQETQAKDAELDCLRGEVSTTQANTDAEVERLQKQLEKARVLAEQDKLRALVTLQEEHQRALRREQAQVDLERE